MSDQEPFEIVQQVLRKASGVNWDDKIRLRAELAEFLTDDLFDGDYELVNVAANMRVAGTFWHDANRVEITVQGFGLPDRAILLRGSDGRWRMKSFLMQCTACLGTGKILDNPCNSCSGMGWGLRPD